MTDFKTKLATVVPVALASVAPVAVFAEGESTGMSSITTGLTNGFTTIGNDAMSALGSILPTALPVLGAVIVITLGIKIFRKVAR